MMDYPRQKIHFVKLQLICIVSGSHDAFRSSKVQSGYIHYIRQHQNQEKIELQQNVPVLRRLIP